jgi:hypothetical protein
VAADVRLDWIISPKLSFQFYLQPFVSSGLYTGFGSLARSRSYEFTRFGLGGSTMSSIIADDGGTAGYALDPDGPGPAPAHAIDNPNFNVVSLRGNAVLRWEYLPGSVLYVVWTQSRFDYEPNGEFAFHGSMSHLFDVHPDNIFMLKLSYWLGG